MPKYYVTMTHADGQDFNQVLSAKDELEACVKSWLRLRLEIKGSTWIVNERGFSRTEDDIYFWDKDVKKALTKFQKKRGDLP